MGIHEAVCYANSRALNSSSNYLWTCPPPFFSCGGCCCCMQNILHFVFLSTKEGEEPSFLFVALPYSGDLDKTQDFEVLVTHDCCHSVLINLIVLYKTIQLTGSNHSFWQGLSGVLGHWWQAQELIDWYTAFLPCWQAVSARYRTFVTILA